MILREKRCFEFGPFRVDAVERVLLRDGKPVPLTPKVFDTLLVLVENSGLILSKNEMMNLLWPDAIVEEANLTTNISVLRKAMGESPNQFKYIETIPWRGYRFVGSVREAQDQSPDLVIEEQTTSHVIIEQKEPPVPSGKLRHPEIAEAHASPDLAVSAGNGRLKHLIVAGCATTLLGVAIVSLNVGGLRERLSGRDNSRAIKSLAVLPLNNLSGDPSQDYLADGMTEALTTEVAKISALRVISRTSALQYKSRRPLLEMARALNVDAVIEGSVMRSGDRVRITVQLIDAGSDHHLWAEDYERDVRDVLALQSEVARAIASRVNVRVSSKEQAVLESVGPVNSQATEAYLKGLFYLRHGLNELTEGKEDTLRKSLEYFEEAIRFDPQYAPAYAGLGRAYHWLASARGHQELYPKAKEVLNRALQLDENLADAHASMAFIIHTSELNWAEAEREYRRALELNRNTGHSGYALLLSGAGRHADAMHEIELALALDPLNLPIKINAGVIYFNARQFDRAIDQFNSIIELHPRNVASHINLGYVYMTIAKHEPGIAAIQKGIELMGGLPAGKSVLAWAYAMSGKRTDAIKLLNELKQQPKPPFLACARISAALGEKDQACDWLEKVYHSRPAELIFLKSEPLFDNLHSEPRFKALLSLIGLSS